LQDWKELWLDEAFWKLLFSLLPSVIMILWRPTNKNQIYAFTPLLDSGDEHGEEGEIVVNDNLGKNGVRVHLNSYANLSLYALIWDLKGMKMRTTRTTHSLGFGGGNFLAAVFVNRISNFRLIFRRL
jgi:hypothetical protein